jgi:uncharacterized protein with WD repeat
MLELRTSVVAFAWEPLGDRFAIVHGAEVYICNVYTYDVIIIYACNNRSMAHHFYNANGNNQRNV